MRKKVLAFLKEQSLLFPGTVVTCGLSGGPDSVAMTHLLWSLQEEFRISLAAIHIHHGLRGADADKDAALCEELCNTWNIPFTVKHCAVTAQAQAEGESIEEAARNCRYAAFRELDGLVATAHTADDQIETVLLQMLRGTGLRGLCGVPPKRGNIIRPLLTVTRQEVLEYLEENHLPYRIDRTNLEDDHLRNRLRHHVVPLLKEENPVLCQTVARMTEHLREDEALLERQAGELLVPMGSGYAVSPLSEAPKALRRRALRRLLSSVPVSKLSAAHITQAEELLSHTGTGELDLPNGKLLRCSYGVITVADSCPPETFSPIFITQPGKIPLGASGLYAVLRDGQGKGLVLEKSLWESGLTIRPRQIGDAMHLPGGSRTLKKLMIDRHIPAPCRHLVPVVAKKDIVVAVWGIGVGTMFRPKAEVPVYTLTIEKEEGAVWQL